MATRMQQRRGTATMWTNANPILGVAEIGYETDTNKFKIGDGTNRWADLTYFVDIDTMIAGAPGLLNSLDEIAAAISDDPAFFTTVATGLATKAPLASPTFTGTVSGVTKAHVGLGNVDNTSDANKPVSTATQTELDLKAPIANPTFTGTVQGVTKSMVGLGDVENTSDANKPVSTAAQTALDLKAPKESPTFTGTVILPANTISTVHLSDDSVGTNEIADGAVTNIKLAGSIAQTKVTDLVSDLALKAPLASPALTGTPSSPTASVGTNTTQVATTAFVHAEIRDLVNLDLLLDGGTLA